MTKQYKVALFIVLFLVLLIFRTWLGTQINFCHEDYTQVFLMGLQYATQGDWIYWGPDVVWSETRLAGGLQPLLVGLPLQSGISIAPFILSNLISGLGLLLFSLYSSYRLKLSKPLVLCFVMTLPFFLHHGSVVLNTAYLLLPGALVMISVFELYLYRETTLLKNKYWYFFGIGFSTFFTYQLHLTWVTFLPFLVVLVIMEMYRKELSMSKIFLFLGLGSLISASTLLPTFWVHHDLVFSGMSDNLTFKPERIDKGLELLTRFLNYTTYDLNPTFDFYKIALDKSTLLKTGLYIMKGIGILQLICLPVLLWFKRKHSLTKPLLILLGLTFVMCLFLYVLSNKHLSSRTYIVLYTIPVFLFLFALEPLKDKKWFNPLIYTLIGLNVTIHLGVGISNSNDIYSVQNQEQKIMKSLETKDTKYFGERRETKMD